MDATSTLGWSTARGHWVAHDEHNNSGAGDVTMTSPGWRGFRVWEVMDRFQNWSHPTNRHIVQGFIQSIIFINVYRLYLILIPPVQEWLFKWLSPQRNAIIRWQTEECYRSSSPHSFRGNFGLYEQKSSCCWSLLINIIIMTTISLSTRTRILPHHLHIWKCVNFPKIFQIYLESGKDHIRVPDPVK